MAQYRFFSIFVVCICGHVWRTRAAPVDIATGVATPASNSSAEELEDATAKTVSYEGVQVIEDSSSATVTAARVVTLMSAEELEDAEVKKRVDQQEGHGVTDGSTTTAATTRVVTLASADELEDAEVKEKVDQEKGHGDNDSSKTTTTTHNTQGVQVFEDSSSAILTTTGVVALVSAEELEDTEVKKKVDQEEGQEVTDSSTTRTTTTTSTTSVATSDEELEVTDGSSKVNYEGAQVVKVEVPSKELQEQLLRLQSLGVLDVWCGTIFDTPTTDILIKSHNEGQVKGFLKNNNMKYKVVIDNVQGLIDDENESNIAVKTAID